MEPKTAELVGKHYHIVHEQNPHGRPPPPPPNPGLFIAVITPVDGHEEYYFDGNSV